MSAIPFAGPVRVDARTIQVLGPPIGESTSIGTVYPARLSSGASVYVKVRASAKEKTCTAHPVFGPFPVIPPPVLLIFEIEMVLGLY